MAIQIDRWPGRRIHRWLFAIWSTAMLGTCASFQFGREIDVLGPSNVVVCFLALVALLVFLIVDATLIALFRGSVDAAIRSLAGSAAFIGFTVAGAFAIQTGSRKLGIGHWPPRDGIFARQYHDRRAEWSAVRDGVLREAKATGSDLSRDVARKHDPYYVGVPHLWKDRFRELGVVGACAAWDGRWVRLALWEGEYKFNPISEKGLLYVAPDLAGEPEERRAHWIAVEDLGDGWYVYEEGW
jgi:uncharacterized membrane protein